MTDVQDTEPPPRCPSRPSGVADASGRRVRLRDMSAVARLQSSSGGSVRADRAAATREAIMTAAERLFVEHGLSAVSGRQVGEAAGQGNSTVVSYHFGGKPGLVRAIMNRHAEAAGRIRERMLAETNGSDDIRDWVGCLVRPLPEYLEILGTPSWYARFAAQVMADPLMRVMVTDEALVRDQMLRTLEGLGRCLGHLPAQVRAERGHMAMHLISHTCAERERALAEGATTLYPSWEHTAEALTDALVGLLLAPVTSPHNPQERNGQ